MSLTSVLGKTLLHDLLCYRSHLHLSLPSDSFPELHCLKFVFIAFFLAILSSTTILDTVPTIVLSI